MKTFPKKLHVLTAAVLSLAASAAMALPSVALPAGAVGLSDDSAEYLIKGTGNTGGSVIEEGDKLRGIFEINKYQVTSGGSPQSLGGVDTNELTGIFEIVITDLVTIGQTTQSGGICASLFCYTFGASASFAAEMAAKGFGNTTGAMVAFFEDINGNDFNRGLNDIATMEANATDGNAFWLAGFGRTFDFWTAGAITNDISQAESLAFNTPFGQFAIGLSLLDNPTGPDLGLVDCSNVQAIPGGLVNGSTNFCGNGGLLAKGPASNPASFQTAYDSLDDVNFNVSVIPEPSSLALTGLALVGLGALARRRKV